MEANVVIVGGGPSGLAISACLTNLNISHVILEREDCYASLWTKRAYDRLNLHLAKEYCSLPFKPHSPSTPTYLTKNDFLQYLDDYVSTFNINPRCCRSVESASYNENINKWVISAKNTLSGDMEIYTSTFLVVATGENNESFIPNFPGMEKFKGEIIHSANYKSGLDYQDKKVLVIGCGNSGMEIAYDLSNYLGHSSIVIRSPFHVLNREMVRLGMRLLKHLPTSIVDFVVITLANFKYGNLNKFGIYRPKKGPFYLKEKTGRTPVLDVGTVKKIKQQKIQVFPGISRINEYMVEFENGEKQDFDVLVFATGYKSAAAKWLKDYEYVLDEDGMPKYEFPTHWKGENGVYCAGLSRRGLFGVSMDAKAISNDIHKLLIHK